MVSKSFLPLGFLILWGVNAAAAAPDCDCFDTRSLREHFRDAKAVFVGTVVSAGDAGVGDIVFELEAVWKTERPQKKTVKVYSDESGCGYHFERSKSYLVFAEGGGAVHSLAVSRCSMIRALWRDSDVLKELGQPVWRSKRYNDLLQGETLPPNNSFERAGQRRGSLRSFPLRPAAQLSSR